MIAAAAFALVLAQAPAVAQSTAPPTAPTVSDPQPLSPVIVPAAPPAPDLDKVAADLAQVYDQACGARIYGTYADACNGLAAQLAKAQAAARKEAARKAKLVKSTQGTSSAY